MGANGKKQNQVILGPALQMLKQLEEAEQRSRLSPEPMTFEQAAIARLDILIVAIDRLELSEAQRAGELNVEREPRPR